MNNANLSFAALNNDALVATTTDLARRCCAIEADLLACLGEIDARQLYLDRAFDSMFSFCVGELGFSEDAAFYRITVARRARELPAMIEALRSRRVHLAGLRLLAPHLTESNHRELLAQAAGKSKRDIEQLLAKLFPQPPAPTVIRKLPHATLPLSAGVSSAPGPSAPAAVAADVAASASVAIPHRSQRPVVAPLAEDAFKIQFTASRAVHDRLREAQDLMRHRVPDGDVATIIGAALELLVQCVKKERFGIGRKARKASSAPAPIELAAPVAHAAPIAPANTPASPPPSDETPDGASTLPVTDSRYVPAEARRAVFTRDGGQCTFVDARGRRCCATSGLEIDHIDGWARTHSHDVDRLRLLCRAHNSHAANRMYGRAFMERARRSRTERTRPGASAQATLF